MSKRHLAGVRRRRALVFADSAWMSSGSIDLRRGVALSIMSATLPRVPTTQPRYTVTDTGETAELLDLAQRAWPEVTDRRQLLLRLATAGGEAVREQLQRQGERAERQRVGLARASELVDVEKLLGDDAWR